MTRAPRPTRAATRRIVGAVIGCSALLAVVPLRAASPASAAIGTPGSGFSATASWNGASLAGNPDPLGPPAATCGAGCDRENFTLHAPAGYTTANVISVTATATFNGGPSGGTADIAILDSTLTVIAQSTGQSSPASVTAKDLAPGAYVVEVDGDIGDPTTTTYQGRLAVTTATRTQQPAHPAGGVTAGRVTVADPFRIGTEPTLAVSPDGTVYEGPIFGLSTTQSFVERSDTNGQTFNTLGVPNVGKNTPCAGGGDEDLSTDPHNNLYFIDLGGITVPASVSADHGNSFTSDCLANDTAATRANYFPDRQWLSTDTVHGVEWYIYRDGLLNASNPTDSVAGPSYGEYIKSAPLANGPAGAAQLAFTSLCTKSGVGVPCTSDVNIAGNAITDNAGPNKGNTYLAMTTSKGVGVAVINPSKSTPFVERTAVPGGQAVLFPTVAVDRGGNVYMAYTDATTFQVKFTASSNQGLTWSAPVVINGAPAAITVMPWIVAGDAGRVDVVFLGSPKTSAPTTNYGPWTVYMAQNLTAATNQAFSAWTQSAMTDRPTHVDPVCLSGLGCTTNPGPGGDRELGDFFRVLLDRDGRAMISFADGNNKVGQLVVSGAQAAPSFASFVRQATGPSLYTATSPVPAIPVPTDSVTVGAHADPFPFAAPVSTVKTNNDALNLLSSAATSDGANVKVHLVIKNLDLTGAVTPPLQPNATYLTRWFHKGQIWFAAAEDNGGTLRYFSGQATPVSDGLAIKYAYYPSGGAATGSFKPGPNGTIDITVPASAVGSPGLNDTLFSVTSYSLTHPSPTTPQPPSGSANATDIPAVVDVLPAYNVLPGPGTPIPESPLTVLLLVVAAIGVGVAVMPRRRRPAAAAG